MVEIFAEVANAHEGDSKRAIDIALRAVGAGAHAVKFQIYFGADLLTEDHPRFRHFCKQSFSREDWIEIITSSQFVVNNPLAKSSCGCGSSFSI